MNHAETLICRLQSRIEELESIGKVLLKEVYNFTDNNNTREGVPFVTIGKGLAHESEEVG